MVTKKAFFEKYVLFLKGMVLWLALAYATSIQAAAIRGDVDGNGEISINDVTILVEYILNESNPPTIADVNGDGEISVSDVLMLVEILLEGVSGPIGDGGGANPEYPVLAPLNAQPLFDAAGISQNFPSLFQTKKDGLNIK